MLVDGERCGRSRRVVKFRPRRSSEEIMIIHVDPFVKGLFVGLSWSLAFVWALAQVH